MTKQEFDSTKCGDNAYVIHDKYPCIASILEINRTTGKIRIFMKNKAYHYSKVKRGVSPKSSGCMAGCYGTPHLIEKLEYVSKPVKNYDYTENR